MTPAEIQDRLESIYGPDEVVANPYDITDDLEKSGAGIESVAQILRFMESKPTADFGSPGALVHFMERFYRQGYEEQLEASLSRRPTSHTVWMLNRIANGAQNPNEHDRLIRLFQGVLEHPLADEDARSSALDFLDFQSQQSPAP